MYVYQAHTIVIYINIFIERESNNVRVFPTLFSASDSESFLISISLSSDNLSASVCDEKNRQNRHFLF